MTEIFEFIESNVYHIIAFILYIHVSNKFIFFQMKETKRCLEIVQYLNDEGTYVREILNPKEVELLDKLSRKLLTKTKYNWLKKTDEKTLRKISKSRPAISVLLSPIMIIASGLSMWSRISLEKAENKIRNANR